MSKYAEGTQVDSGRSRNEIENTVTRFGATSFAYGWQDGQAMIGFHMRDRQIRLVLPMPDRNSPEFTRTPGDKIRSTTAAAAEFEKAVRQRWRSLALVVKAKLVAVEDGIVTFEEEWGMHIVMPDGRTVAEHVSPAIEQAYLTREVRPLLTLGPGE